MDPWERRGRVPGFPVPGTKLRRIVNRVFRNRLVRAAGQHQQESSVVRLYERWVAVSIELGVLDLPVTRVFRCAQVHLGIVEEITAHDHSVDAVIAFNIVERHLLAPATGRMHFGELDKRSRLPVQQIL